MKTTNKQNGITVQSKAKAGAIVSNHNQQGIVVRTKTKAGAITSNHNQKTA